MYTGICCMTRHELLWCIPLTSHDAAQYWGSTDIRQRKDISTFLARKTSGDKKLLLFEHGPWHVQCKKPRRREQERHTRHTTTARTTIYTPHTKSELVIKAHSYPYGRVIEKQYQYLFNTCEGLTKFIKAAGWRRGAKKIKKNKKLQK